MCGIYFSVDLQEYNTIDHVFCGHGVDELCQSLDLLPDGVPLVWDENDTGMINLCFKVVGMKAREIANVESIDCALLFNREIELLFIL